MFHVPRQLLLLQDSFLTVPVMEFAQCYLNFFIFIFILEIANSLSRNRARGGLDLFPPPVAQPERSDLSWLCHVLLLPMASTRSAQGNVWGEKPAKKPERGVAEWGEDGKVLFLWGCFPYGRWCFP